MEDVSCNDIFNPLRLTTQTILKTRKTSRKKKIWTFLVTTLISPSSSHYLNSKDKSYTCLIAKNIMISTSHKNYTQFSCRLLKNYHEKSQESLSSKVSEAVSFLLRLDIIDPSIRERFNPCIFLGEFLMRNNSNHGTKLEY